MAASSDSAAVDVEPAPALSVVDFGLSAKQKEYQDQRAGVMPEGGAAAQSKTIFYKDATPKMSHFIHATVRLRPAGAAAALLKQHADAGGGGRELKRHGSGGGFDARGGLKLQAQLCYEGGPPVEPADQHLLKLFGTRENGPATLELNAPDAAGNAGVSHSCYQTHVQFRIERGSYRFSDKQYVVRFSAAPIAF